jgi:hypothetical protein
VVSNGFLRRLCSHTMAMAAKAAAAAAEVDALLARVQRHLPEEYRLAATDAASMASWPPEHADDDGRAPPDDDGWEEEEEEALSEGDGEEYDSVDVSASLEADTDVLFAGSPIREQPSELPPFEELDSSPVMDVEGEGIFSDADSEEQDEQHDAAAATEAAEGGGESPANRRRRRGRARRRARQTQRRSSTARLAELAQPVVRRVGSPSRVSARQPAPRSKDSTASPDSWAAAAQSRRRQDRLLTLEKLAVEYASVAAHLSTEDQSAFISQMEAMYDQVQGDVVVPQPTSSQPTAAAESRATERQTSATSKGPSRKGRSISSSSVIADDPWASVRKSAAAMEHSVRQYAGSSERPRPRALGISTLSQSVEEAELMRSVQRALGESMAVSSELSKSIDDSSSSSSSIFSTTLGLGSGATARGSTDAMRRWKDLSNSRAVRRPPCTLVRWLETGWHHHSSATNSRGFEIRNDGEDDDGDNDSDIDDNDDTASFVRFVQRHAAGLGSMSVASVDSDSFNGDYGGGTRSVRSSLSTLPPSGLTRTEVNSIGRNYLAHCHENGPKERAVRAAQRNGATLIENGRYVEAIQLIDEGLTVAQERKQECETRALSELCIKARQLLVAELNSIGRATEAIRVCTTGLRLLPADPDLQAAMDDTVPQVLAAEEFLDAASTALAMHNLADAKEALLNALELDVASTRLPPLLEAGAEMGKEQGDQETAAVLRREAGALGAFDRQMQAAWVRAERAEAETTSTSTEQQQQSQPQPQRRDLQTAGSSRVRRVPESVVMEAAEAAAEASRRAHAKLEEARVRRATHPSDATNTRALSPTQPAQHPADIDHRYPQPSFPEFPEPYTQEEAAASSMTRSGHGGYDDGEVLTPWVAGE